MPTTVSVTVQRTPPARGISIRDSVDFGELAKVQRPEIRARLRVGPQDTLIAALPPVSRPAGTFTVAWAALLLEKVRPDVRLVVPEDGPERERIAWLVRSSRHEHVVRFAGPDLTLAELVSAADLVALLPTRSVPLTGLAWAMAAGCPVVASAIPAIAKHLADGQTAWLCRPDNPKDAAAQMLQAIENPPEAQRRAHRARALANSICTT